MRPAKSETGLSMSTAANYADWTAAAQAHDRKTGKDKWKAEDHDSRYDYHRIRESLDILRHARETDDARELLYTLNEGIHGNIGGIAHPGLYSEAKFGTKTLIHDYILEVTRALDYLSYIPDSIIPFEERLDFFRRASHCYGRSALMLSGAGSRTAFHVGVVNALYEENLLPKIISGSSGGALVAAVIGTCEHSEIAARLNYERIADMLEIEKHSETSKGLRPQAMSHDRLLHMVETLIPNMTFEEAFEVSGKHINISVASTDENRKSRLLNVITSPHVFVREAVTASCSVPGVFPPVRLAAKHYDGTRKPYLPELEWIDGSVTDDLPTRRLGRLYGVNHFLASQTNPAIIWGISDTAQKRGIRTITRAWLDQVFKANLRASRPLVRALTKNISSMNSMSHIFYSVALQRYTADVNIMPTKRWLDPRKLLSEIPEAEARDLVEDGRRVTWPKIEMIRNSSVISRCLDDILDRYEHDVEKLHYLQKARLKPPQRRAKRKTAQKRVSKTPTRKGRRTKAKTEVV